MKCQLNYDLMGKQVVVTRRLQKKRWVSAANERTVEQVSTECEPFTGWIVGFRSLPYGRVRLYGYPDGGNEFQEKGRIACVLVSRTPYENPLRVPLDGYTVITDET